jgi:hypothetical protein
MPGPFTRVCVQSVVNLEKYSPKFRAYAYVHWDEYLHVLHAKYEYQYGWISGDKMDWLKQNYEKVWEFETLYDKINP